MPDIGVLNGRKSSHFDFSSEHHSRLSVNWQGEITWMYGVILDVTCPLNVSFFPFDTQTCHLILAPWQSDNRHIIMRTVQHGSIVDNR
ncbi:unnamed protein product [Protopolystoma xenopodis]|uniref:Neurotransmitter-gated ion-channel ligand-binding domain-containing protein n=1 Tax=Protopolystoma xenopodis TaxID=117903 RepID=A0A3S5CRQ1_9PLAT|nr:unnamed protein product [Protopolystoma xenopodis]